MIILGIDPGTTLVGYGVVKKNKNSHREVEVIDYGLVETLPKAAQDDKLKRIFISTNRLIDKFQPKFLAVEKLFFFKNRKTIIEVAQARGVIIAAAALKNIPIIEATPLQVKIATVGYGRASKSQVQIMIKNILGLSEIPQPDDVADALAIAYYGAIRTGAKLIPKN